MAESISINTKFTKVKSPYIGESLLKLMCIQDLNTFNVSSEKVRCSTCDVYILKSRMIGHVGKHLALNEIAPHLNNCGTCGLIGCSIEVFTKGRGNSKHDSAKSSCSNFPKNLSIHIAKKASKYSPCTNHPVRCEVCNKCFWSYNMETHYKAEHVHLKIPECFILDDEEIDNVIKLTF